MTKTVLCAIDVTEPEQDRAVLHQAARLAKAEGAQLDVMTVVPDFGLSMVSGYFNEGHHDEAVEDAKARLNAFAAAELGDEVNANVRHVVGTGKAYEQILKTAKASKSDLIVIGAHSPDLSDFLLGPNAARVVRHSKCSVFVVR